MHYKILHKLRKAGATSKDSAVTIREEDLDSQERMWLDYFVGAFLGKIKIQRIVNITSTDKKRF